MKQFRRIPWITAALSALVVLLAVQLYVPTTTTHFPSAVNAAAVADARPVTIEQLADSSTTFNQIYQAVSPSVVAISDTIDRGGQVIGSASGSGFVLDTEGHILTNDHVVANGTNIEVEFYDGTLAWAEVVGTDAEADLAVLKVDVPQATLHPVTFRDSDTLQIGEAVLAIGSPFGEKWTLTSGIISGLDRTIQGQTQFSIGGVIQTDAAINPGNSGGPLLDLNGQVIGVNSQIATTSSSNSGVGFAIPGNLAQRVAQDLIGGGRTQWSYLGISGGDLTMSLIDALNLPANTRGVVVSEVTPNGPADQAGLKSATGTMSISGQGRPTSLDIITAIDGHQLKGMDDLVSYLARETQPGQTVKLSVLRNGQDQIELNVKLAPRPSMTS